MSFIHRFTVKDAFFVYDVNTNSIIEVDEVIYSLCPHFNKTDIISINKMFEDVFTLDSIQRAWKTITKYNKQKGHFSCIYPVNKNKTFQWHQIVNEVNTNLRQIVLNVTDNCNLRCSYCPYTCSPLSKRAHNKQNMSIDVAKKSIDYFIAHSYKQKGFISLGFYGGEPLLNFKLIKWCINYISKIHNNDIPIIYSITSNGTLISKEIIEFLVENNIVLLISLDGPRKIHDKNRVDINHQGTFNRIISNLEKIKKIAPNYYKYNVRFSIVLTGGTDYQQLDEFFSRFSLAVRISSFEEFEPNTLNHLDIFKNPLLNFDKMKQKFTYASIQNIFNSRSEHKNYSFVKNLFENSLQRIHRRYPCKNLITDPPGNSICIPGAHRIFVSTKGLFYTCEKTESNANMLIGDIDKGIELGSVNGIIQNYHNFIHKYCKNCWLIRMCSSCFVHAALNNNFNDEKFSQNCHIRKKVFHEALRMYIEIGRQNPNAFDWLEKDPLDTLMDNDLNP